MHGNPQFSFWIPRGKFCCAFSALSVLNYAKMFLYWSGTTHRKPQYLEMSRTYAPSLRTNQIKVMTLVDHNRHKQCYEPIKYLQIITKYFLCGLWLCGKSRSFQGLKSSKIQSNVWRLLSNWSFIRDFNLRNHDGNASENATWKYKFA